MKAPALAAGLCGVLIGASGVFWGLGPSRSDADRALGPLPATSQTHRASEDESIRPDVKTPRARELGTGQGPASPASFSLMSLGTELANDPGRALTELARLKTTSDRRAFITGLMIGAATLPTAAAVDLASRIESVSERRAALVELAQQWGVDPYAPETQVYLKTTSLEGALGVLLGLQDPIKGVAWAEGLLDGAERRQALADSLRQLARGNPQSAVAYLRGLSDPQDHADLLRGVALGWAEHDGAAAFAWSTALPASEDKIQAASSAAIIWAKNDLEAATRAALASSARVREAALSSIARSVNQRDRAQADTWAASLPEDARQAALQTIHSIRIGGRLTRLGDGTVIFEPHARAGSPP
jgi:hypothetical protein